MLNEHLDTQYNRSLSKKVSELENERGHVEYYERRANGQIRGLSGDKYHEDTDEFSFNARA